MGGQGGPASSPSAPTCAAAPCYCSAALHQLLAVAGQWVGRCLHRQAAAGRRRCRRHCRPELRPERLRPGPHGVDALPLPATAHPPRLRVRPSRSTRSDVVTESVLFTAFRRPARRRRRGGGGGVLCVCNQMCISFTVVSQARPHKSVNTQLVRRLAGPGRPGLAAKAPPGVASVTVLGDGCGGRWVRRGEMGSAANCGEICPEEKQTSRTTIWSRRRAWPCVHRGDNDGGMCTWSFDSRTGSAGGAVEGGLQGHCAMDQRGFGQRNV